MKHTPGPWELDAGRVFKTSGGEFYITYGKDRYGNPLWKSGFSELDSSARLIAAAPELLEALNKLTVAAGEADALQHAGLNVPPKVWADIYQANQAARAAIAKAEGRE